MLIYEVAQWRAMPKHVRLAAMRGSLAASRSQSRNDLQIRRLQILGDNDRDMRAVGLEQVREEAKGAEATQAICGAAAQAVPDAQVGFARRVGRPGRRRRAAGRAGNAEERRDPRVRTAAIAGPWPAGRARPTCRPWRPSWPLPRDRKRPPPRSV